MLQQIDSLYISEEWHPPHRFNNTYIYEHLLKSIKYPLDVDASKIQQAIAPGGADPCASEIY